MCRILSPIISLLQVKKLEIESCVIQCIRLTNFSTIFLLQEYQWRAKSNNMDLIPNYISVRDTSDETLSTLDHLATTAQGFRDQMVDTTSVLVATPFLAHVAYQAALFLIRLSRGEPDDITTRRMSLFKELLQDIVPRWKMASMFIAKMESYFLVTMN